MSGATQWTVGSLALRDAAIDIIDTSGWEGFPGRRGSNIEIPGVTGSFFVRDKPYPERSFSLALVVFPWDSTGAVTTTPGQHIQTNIDTLFDELTANVLISVQKSVDAGPTREALCEVVNTIDVGPYGSHPYARAFVVQFNVPDAFWRELPQITGEGPPSTTPGGNAPVHDPVVTLNGGTDTRLTNTTNGDWVEITGALGGTPVIIDVGARTVTQGGTPIKDRFRTNNRRWFTLFTATNNLSVSGGGTASIDYYRKWVS